MSLEPASDGAAAGRGPGRSTRPFMGSLETLERTGGLCRPTRGASYPLLPEGAAPPSAVALPPTDWQALRPRSRHPP